jgi:hypothetical protein
MGKVGPLDTFPVETSFGDGRGGQALRLAPAIQPASPLSLDITR